MHPPVLGTAKIVSRSVWETRRRPLWVIDLEIAGVSFWGMRRAKRACIVLGDADCVERLSSFVSVL